MLNKGQGYGLRAAPPYLGGQQPGQVYFRHHLAASVPLPLVWVVVVLHQVPQFGAALQVGGDHRGPRAQTVGAARRPEHALWSDDNIKIIGNLTNISQKMKCCKSEICYKSRINLEEPATKPTNQESGAGPGCKISERIFGTHLQKVRTSSTFMLLRL